MILMLLLTHTPTKTNVFFDATLGSVLLVEREAERRRRREMSTRPEISPRRLPSPARSPPAAADGCATPNCLSSTAAAPDPAEKSAAERMQSAQ